MYCFPDGNFTERPLVAQPSSRVWFPWPLGRPASGPHLNVAHTTSSSIWSCCLVIFSPTVQQKLVNMGPKLKLGKRTVFSKTQLNVVKRKRIREFYISRWQQAWRLGSPKKYHPKNSGYHWSNIVEYYGILRGSFEEKLEPEQSSITVALDIFY